MKRYITIFLLVTFVFLGARVALAQDATSVTTTDATAENAVTTDVATDSTTTDAAAGDTTATDAEPTAITSDAVTTSLTAEGDFIKIPFKLREVLSEAELADLRVRLEAATTLEEREIIIRKILESLFAEREAFIQEQFQEKTAAIEGRYETTRVEFVERLEVMREAGVPEEAIVEREILLEEMQARYDYRVKAVAERHVKLQEGFAERRAEMEIKRTAFQERVAELEERRAERLTKRAERVEIVLGNIDKRFEVAIERFEKFIERLDSRIAKLAGEGVDTDKAEELVDLAQTKLDEAADKVSKMQALFTDFTFIDPEDARELHTELKAFATDAKGLLKDAHGLLVDAVKELKNAVAAAKAAQTDEDTNNEEDDTSEE